MSNPFIEDANRELLAENARLKCDVARLEAEMEQTVGERDNYHDWADQLAEAIAQHLQVGIGEHTSDNNPWLHALVHLSNYPCALDITKIQAENHQMRYALEQVMSHVRMMEQLLIRTQNKAQTTTVGGITLDIP